MCSASPACSKTINSSSSLNTSPLMESLPDDILLEFFKRMKIKDRLISATVNQRWNQLSKKWSDIETVTISKTHFSIKSEYMEDSCFFPALNPSQINPKILMFMKKCSHTSNLVIHNSYVLNHFASIWSKFTNVNLLVLPNNVFDELSSKDSASLAHVLSSPKLNSLLVLNHVKSFPSKTRIFTPFHVSLLKSPRLEILHLNGVVIGPLALEHFAEKFHKSLIELRIGGACVNTSAAEQYWKAIAKFEKLKVLEVPPSLFSVSNPLASQHLPILSGIKKLQRISIYVCSFIGGEFNNFVAYLPKSCRKILAQTWGDDCVDKAIAKMVDQKIKLVIIPNGSRPFLWPFNNKDNGNAELSVKASWLPPYFPQTELHRVNITSDIAGAQRTNWQCILPDLKNFEEKSLASVPVNTAEENPLTTARSSSSTKTANGIAESGISSITSSSSYNIVEIDNRNTSVPNSLIQPANPPMIVSAQSPLLTAPQASVASDEIHLDDTQHTDSSYSSRYSVPSSTAPSSERDSTQTFSTRSSSTESVTSTSSSVGTAWFN